MRLILSFLLTLSMVSCEDPVADGRTATRPSESRDEFLTPETGEELPDNLFTLVGVNAKAISSHGARKVESPIMSYFEEQQAIWQEKLKDKNYLDTPVISLTDEGHDASSLVKKNVASSELCGTGVGIETIYEAIVQCSQKKSSQWNAQRKGLHGESNWYLVIRDEVQGGISEVWLDSRTGLLWSDVITAQDWCKASGNQEENDVLCSREGTEKVCQDNLYLSAKGLLNSNNVQWRLPTRNDWLQADIDGARFVLPNMNQAFWTATVNSMNREQAWSYHGAQGLLQAEDRSAAQAIRCVGRILYPE